MFLNLFIRIIRISVYLRHISVLHGCVSSLGIGEGGHATTSPVTSSMNELSQVLVLCWVPPLHELEHAPHVLQVVQRLVSEYEIRTCLLKYINFTFATILNFVVKTFFRRVTVRLLIVITR